ncbi:MAG: alpha-amylase family glycosyl hydrolase [Planctomycetota bacterium]
MITTFRGLAARFTPVITMLSVLACTSPAFGQATTNQEAAGTSEGVPAPASERLDPILDVWWQDAVFYEIFVRSFGDSSQGPLANDGVGDLRGLIERLDYLNDGDPDTTRDLGVTGIWLMPIMQSPSYHGYDTVDYYRIDDEYGTNEDFKELVRECHARGIKVIIDLVLNHCSSQHPWFVDAQRPGSDKRDWFIWSPTKPTYKGPWGQTVWHDAPNGSGEAFYGQFWHGMPDLNFRHPPVTEELNKIVRFWLEEMGADGFRLDAIRLLVENGKAQENTPETHAWLRDFFDLYKSINPDAFTVGEVWSGSEIVTRYVGDQMDVAFEFSLSYAITNAVKEKRAAPVLERMQTVTELYPLGMYATFLRNHDEPRTAHELGGDLRAAGLAATIQFALPGVPFVYYGEEIGMSATKHAEGGDANVRTPMQWTAPDSGNDRTADPGFSRADAWRGLLPDRPIANVQTQHRQPDSLLNLYRRLARLRHAHPALRIGTYTPIQTSRDDVLAFRRTFAGNNTHPAEDLLCVFNLSDQPITNYELNVPDDLRLARQRELLHRARPAKADKPIKKLAPQAGYVVALGADEH